MNSDQLTPDTLASTDTAVSAPAEETTTPSARRSRARRTTTSTADTGPEMATDVTSDTGVPAPATARRRRSAGARNASPAGGDAASTTPAPEIAREDEIDSARIQAPEIIEPLNAQDALVSEGSTGDTATAEAPLSRNRRRRGRGGRTPEPAALVAVDLPLEAEAPPPSLNPVEPELLLDGQTLDTADTELSSDSGEAMTNSATEGGLGGGRRRRRRGRGGRNTGLEAADADADAPLADDVADVADVAASDVAAPTHYVASIDSDLLKIAEPELEPAAPTSPAVRRRFDHSSWRERLGVVGAAASTDARQAAVPALVEAIATTRLAPAPTAAVPGSTTPPAFERPGRGRRFGGGDRQSYARTGDTAGAGIPEVQPPTSALPERAQPNPFTLIPTVTPSIAAPASSIATSTGPASVAPMPAPASSPIVTPSTADITPLPATSMAGGSADERLVERLERLLQTQSNALQQQGQAIQALTSTMAALQGAIERMSTIGIAAGMPRAGMFVDAPNIVYAAENARVNIDYGRMLDFLGRGREMVHAIVYAPVTEDNGYRYEQQRFVAPFLNKGYKMVTKPLKRFPDGTAKGNFDIELAIDIVTMSQRLDVVILISGDSDFSRLVELIQSRGVRVEVVSFASNVSWELVQMADVFIDVGQYINEFRAL